MNGARDALSAISIEAEPASFTPALGEAFGRYGFAVITDHGIDPMLVDRANSAARAFFALPAAVKRRYHLEGGGGARGYTPFGIETAKGAAVPDLKEFWHVGRDLPAGHALSDTMPPNIWPAEIADFQAALTTLFAAFEEVGGRILEGIAIHLGVKPTFMADSVHDGNSIIRLLHYPPVPDDSSAIRAEAHEDINAITLLLGAEEAGLELKTLDGMWLPIRPDKGELVVNIGDMLARLTNDRLRSTSHRVVNPDPARSALPRYSTPFFLHFRSDFLIETLPGCVDHAHPDRYPDPITADVFLQQRLSEIGLIPKHL